MDYVLLESEGEVEELPIPEKSGLIKNLSGSGLLAWVEDEDELTIGSRMVVDIHLPAKAEPCSPKLSAKKRCPMITGEG